METNNGNQQPQTNPSLPQIQSSLNPIPNQKGNFLIPIGIIILILIVGAGAYYLGTKQNQPIMQDSQKIITSPTVSTQNPPAASPISDTTANWKTFSSTTFSLSYKYPSDWKNDNFCQSCSAEPIIESSSERYLHPVGTKYPDGITYSADAKANSAPLSYFINSLKARTLTNKTSKELSVNGSSGFEVIGNDENGEKIALVVFENQNYIFQFTGSENYITTLEGLLPTVTFK